jgi:hypothetical protein
MLKPIQQEIKMRLESKKISKFKHIEEALSSGNNGLYSNINLYNYFMNNNSPNDPYYIIEENNISYLVNENKRIVLSEDDDEKFDFQKNILIGPDNFNIKNYAYHPTKKPTNWQEFMNSKTVFLKKLKDFISWMVVWHSFAKQHKMATSSLEATQKLSVVIAKALDSAEGYKILKMALEEQSVAEGNLKRVAYKFAWWQQYFKDQAEGLHALSEHLDNNTKKQIVLLIAKGFMQLSNQIELAKREVRKHAELTYGIKSEKPF